MFNKIISQKESISKALKLTMLALFSAFMFSTASADIIFTEDFETNYTQAISVKNSLPTHPSLSPVGNAPKIITSKNGVTPRAGSHMMEAYLSRFKSNINYRTSAKPHNYQQYNTEFEEGKAYWVGISVFIPADWSMDYGSYSPTGKYYPNFNEGIILDFHDRSYLDKSWRRGLPLVVRTTKQGFQISNRAAGCDKATVGCTPGKTIQTFNKPNIPMKRGQWNDFIFHIKWSPKSDGFLQVWVNGEKELDETGRNYYDEHTRYPYFKFGLYQSSWKLTGWSKDFTHNTNERTLYFDEVRFGDSKSNYDEVMPSGKTPTKDSKAPSAPSNLKASGITQTSINLNWNASSDNVGVSVYEVYYYTVGGSIKTKVTSGTSTTLTGLSPNINYSIKVRAKDAAGNLSVASNIETAVTDSEPVANTPPKISNINAQVSNEKTVVTWKANVPAKAIVVFYAKDVDPKHLSVKTYVTNGYLEIPKSHLVANKKYTYYVRVTDQKGTKTQSANFNFVTPNKDTPTPSFTLNYTVGNGGKLIGATKQTIKKGASATSVTAVANNGYTFAKWSDGLTSAARTDKNITKNATFTATFTPVIILVADAGNNKTLNCEDSYRLVGNDAKTTDNSTYKWTTTNGNIQAGTNRVVAQVNKAGTYTLTVSKAGSQSVSDSVVITAEGNCNTTPLPDNDKDGTPDSADTDDDNDKVLDVNDAFPFDASETIDTDNDGVGNNADTDDDNDGYSDADERAAGTDPLNSSDKPTTDNSDNTTDNSNENKSDESAGSFPIGLLMLGLLALARRR